MAMMKSRKPKRYADGGGVKMAELASPARRPVMPGANYRPGFDPQHNYFPSSPMGDPQASQAPMDSYSGPGRDRDGYYIGTGEGGDSSEGANDMSGQAADNASANSTESGTPGSGADPGAPGAAGGVGDPGDPGSGAAVAKGGLIKLKKMSKGGKVRGCGIAVRGKGRGTMR